MEINFIEEIDSGFFDWNNVRKWLIESVLNENLEINTLNFVFMDDEALLGYNKSFLNHDYYTDVITFDESSGLKIEGDILISVTRIKDNALLLGVEFVTELLRVIIHGVLHLCGYKDKLPEEIKVMREKEEYYLSRVSFT